MAITRPTLSTGITTFVDGQILTAADMETEFLALFNGVANLDDSFIAANAAIDPTKVDDFSASAAEQRTATDPGTGASPSLATDLSLELSRLRYVIERISLGITGTNHVVRYDGSSNVNLSWIERPQRFGNHLYNGRFSLKSTDAVSAPDGWTLVDTPTNCALAAAVVAESPGTVLNITANAANEGISQTLAGLKASTRYLCVARMRANAGTARMKITGADATSQYRDVTVDTTSSSFVTLAAVIQTDSTPTAIVYSVLGVANGANVDISYCAVFECSSEILEPASVIVRTTDVSVGSVIAGNGVLSAAFLSTAICVPGNGYAIRVTTKIDITPNAVSNFVIFLYEDGTEKDAYRMGIPTGLFGTASPSWINRALVPGTTYTYTVKGYGLSQAAAMNSAATAAGETPNSYLDLELVKL